jgi:hypothetical protein
MYDPRPGQSAPTCPCARKCSATADGAHPDADATRACSRRALKGVRGVGGGKLSKSRRVICVSSSHRHAHRHVLSLSLSLSRARAHTHTHTHTCSLFLSLSLSQTHALTSARSARPSASAAPASRPLQMPARRQPSGGPPSQPASVHLAALVNTFDSAVMVSACLACSHQARSGCTHVCRGANRCQ